MVVENYTSLLDFGIEIVAPIIIRPFQSSEIYELAVVTSNYKSQSLYFVSVLKGKLTFYEKLNQTDPKTYVFQTQDLANESYVSLLRTCQMNLNAMEQIGVQKVVIIFVSMSDVIQIERIAENITAYIKAAKMQDYRFSEFRLRAASCEDLRNHFKSNADNEISALQIFIVSAFILLVVAISVAKSVALHSRNSIESSAR